MMSSVGPTALTEPSLGSLSLGIDIGSSRTKAVLVDAAGTRLSESSTSYAHHRRTAGVSEWNPEDWWNAAVTASRAAIALVPGGASRVRSVGVTGQMRGVVLLDAAGCVQGPALGWDDRRCEAEVEMLAARWAASPPAARLSPLNSMCTLPKLMWLKTHRHRDLTDARHLLFPKDYVRYLLTEAWGTDPSDASGSLCWDIEGEAWLVEEVAALGIDPDILPVVHPSAGVAGGLTRAAAHELGLAEGTAVITGMSDSVAEAYAIGPDSLERVKIRAGTSGAVSRRISDLGALPQQVAAWSDVNGGLWVADVNTRTCAEAIAWLGRVAYAEVPAKDRWAVIDADALSVPDSGGVTFEPHLDGEDAPYWDRSLTASWTGMRLGTTRAHLARAVIDGVAASLCRAGAVLGSTSRTSELVLIGGASRLASLQNAIATAFDAPILVLDSAEPADGVARLAAVGTGLTRNSQPPQSGHLVAPQPPRGSSKLDEIDHQ